MSSRRRHLRVYYSSSPQPPSPPPQEEEHVDIEVDLHESLEAVNLDPPNPILLPSSDDDDQPFIDVSDNLSPPSPPPRHHPQPVMDRNSSAAPPSASPVGVFLRGLGLSLRSQWLDSCLRTLETSIPRFEGFGVEAKAKLCFEQFLFSDMNCVGAGIMPENVHALHLVDLPGPFVLQVDEIVNIGSALKSRYKAANPSIKRCLKLSMTDGVQLVFGMEYRPIKDLQVLAPAGLKIVIRNVSVRRGILVLVPEVVEVLGGMVEDLEAARQRLVLEVNKPPRGIRTRNGVVPPLSTRATLAAWPPNGDSSADTRASTSGSAAPMDTNATMPQSAAPTQAAQQGNAPGLSTSDRIPEELNVPNSRSNAEPNITSTAVPDIEEIEMVDETLNSRANAEPNTPSTAVADIEEIDIVDEAPSSRANAESNLPSTIFPDIEDVPMVDDDEPAFVLSGDREIPFTYLSSLFAKWAALKNTTPKVQGKIKCFMTGVKGFQYKQQAKYELRVYVDDGSLISEILIVHEVVQEIIGHSPQEVTAALSSSDRIQVKKMREILTQFQFYLANFEGIMLMEISESSPLPIALEMNQGCPISDAWLLLKRLQSPNTNHPQQHQVEPINLSP